MLSDIFDVIHLIIIIIIVPQKNQGVKEFRK